MHHTDHGKQQALDTRELQEALEDGCGALVAMQASAARITTGAGDLDGVEAELSTAIASLRSAIAQLRGRAAPAAGQLAGGFVLDPGDRPPGRVQLI